MENKIPFEFIFRNEKILNNLLSYLSLSEQKDLLRTCKLGAESVRKSSTFLQKSKLIICDKSIEETKLFTTITNNPWRNVRIEVSNISLNALETVKRILRNVESVELHMLNGYNQEMTSLTLTHNMTEIISSAHQIKCLTMDCVLMEKELRNVLTDARVQMRLRNLQELSFVHSVAKSDTFNSIREYAAFGKVEFRQTYKILGTYGLWTRNFNHLLGIPMNLKQLDVGKIVSSKESHLSVLPALLNNHVLTLNKLTVPMNIWSKGINFATFPALESLTFRASHHEEDFVRKFLGIQPDLKYLDVGFVSGFPLSILMLIQAKASPEKLKTLSLKCNHFVGSLDPINWTFLRSLAALDNFSLNLTGIPKKSSSSNLIAPTYFMDVLTMLPKTVKKILLKNVHLKGYAMTEQQRSLTESTMRGFECLTKFNVMGCSQVVDDALLQLIFATITGLKLLKFSHCDQVTRFGLTGVKSNGLSTGYSLGSLKDLREFAIRHCPAVTSGDLLNAVKLERLQMLDIFTAQPNVKSTVVQLLKQNPSLEKIYVNISRMDFNELTILVGRTNHRTCQLTRLLDPKSFRVDDHTESSEGETEDKEVEKDRGDTATCVPVSAKTIAALKIADKLKELCFDDEFEDDDLSRFDSEDDDEFQGCSYVPG